MTWRPSWTVTVPDKTTTNHDEAAVEIQILPARRDSLAEACLVTEQGLGVPGR